MGLLSHAYENQPAEDAADTLLPGKACSPNKADSGDNNHKQLLTLITIFYI
jgi:hypothetical protein